MHGNCIGKERKKKKIIKDIPPKLEFFFLCQKVLQIEIGQQPKQKRYPRSYPIYYLTTYVSKLSRGALTSVAFPTARTTNFNWHWLPNLFRKKGRRVSWADEFISLKILASSVSISMKEISPSTKLVCPPHHLEIRVRKSRRTELSAWPDDSFIFIFNCFS